VASEGKAHAIDRMFSAETRKSERRVLRWLTSAGILTSPTQHGAATDNGEMAMAIKSKFSVGDRVKFAHPFNGTWTGTVTSVERAGIRKRGIAFDYFHVSVAFDGGEEESLTDNNDRLSIA
jgi:hypothetical protein